MKEKIWKLLSSGNQEDVNIALHLLLSRYNRDEIVEFFRKNKGRTTLIEDWELAIDHNAGMLGVFENGETTITVSNSIYLHYKDMDRKRNFSITYIKKL